EAARRLVERNPRQRAGIDRRDELVAVPKVLCAVGCPRCKAREIIERLVMGLEVRAPGAAVVDDRALRIRFLSAIGQRGIPRACVPRPAYALCRERIANRL